MLHCELMPRGRAAPTWGVATHAPSSETVSPPGPRLLALHGTGTAHGAHGNTGLGMAGIHIRTRDVVARKAQA